MSPPQILIIGSSISGPALATLLLLTPTSPFLQPHITLLERRPKTHLSAGQNIDIRPPGLPVIQLLGLESAVRSATTGEVGVRFVDKDDKVWASFPAMRGGPTADIEIMRGRLAELLVRRCEDVSADLERRGGRGVEFIYGDYVDELVQDGEKGKVNVRFAKSGERRSFDIVVGADGLQSSTRKIVWGMDGEEQRVKRLGMYAAFFSMPALPKDGLWRRWFHAEGRRGVMLRPDVSRNKVTAFMYVINEKDGRVPKVADRGREDMGSQKALMAEYFGDVGWESERVIKEMMGTDDFYYDLVGQVKMEKWSKGRVVLLGDAGFCASPISGMGTTLALNGAYQLAGALTQHPDDHEAAFAAYEQKMRPLVDRAQKLTPGMPHLLNPETAWGVWVLNAIMFVLWQSGLIGLLVKLIGPGSGIVVSLEDYGFRRLPEWTDGGSKIY